LTIVTTAVYIAGAFSKDREERIFEHTTLIELRFFKQEKTLLHFLRSRSIWSFQRIHQELNFCILLELWNWLHIST